MDPSAGARGVAGPRGLRSTDVVDDLTVRFTLEAPACSRPRASRTSSPRAKGLLSRSVVEHAPHNALTLDAALGRAASGVLALWRLQ